MERDSIVITPYEAKASIVSDGGNNDCVGSVGERTRQGAVVPE